jgi:glycosyltransferase involved in cell wall biosynthesis
VPTGRRNVAIYVPALVGGGAERVAALLASGLSRDGYQVTLIVDFEAPENRGLVDADIAIVTLGGGHARSTLRLAGLLRERRFAIALAIGASANIKLVIAQVIARTETRLILSYHGTSGVGRGWLGWSAYPLAPLLTRRAARTVCVSDYIVRHMVEDWHSPPARLVRIYNPVRVDCARPPASAAELKLRPPAIIALGRLAAEKNFTTLVNAFALVPQRASRLVIYGEGPERDALQRLVDRLGLAGRVELPGYIADPWDAYSKASCFVLASRSEAFGNVVVEALASGLPVVSTDCGGPVEILDFGRYGEIVPVGEPTALAAAIGRALDRPGEPARRIARARDFADEAIVKCYATLFEDVLTDRTATP